MHLFWKKVYFNLFGKKEIVLYRLKIFRLLKVCRIIYIIFLSYIFNFEVVILPFILRTKWKFWGSLFVKLVFCSIVFMFSCNLCASRVVSNTSRESLVRKLNLLASWNSSIRATARVHIYLCVSSPDKVEVKSPPPSTNTSHHK